LQVLKYTRYGPKVQVDFTQLSLKDRPVYLNTHPTWHKGMHATLVARQLCQVC